MALGSVDAAARTIEKTIGSKATRKRRKENPFANVPTPKQLGNREVKGPFTPKVPRSALVASGVVNPGPLAPLRLAITQAYYHGVEPDYPSLEKTFGLKAAQLAQHAYISHIAGNENLGTPEDLTNLITAATGVGGLAKLGIEQLGKFGAETAIKEAGATAAESGAKDAAGGIKGLLAQAAKRAEPEAVQAARQAAKEAADQLPQGVKTAAKVAAKGASYPVRHPIQSPFALAVPQAVATGDPIGALKGALEGKGLYAGLTGGVAHALGGLPGEAVGLPASVLPSAFLAGKAGVNALKGDPKQLDALLANWKETGVLPDLAEGDLGGAAHNLQAHPLYGLLEGSGALNAAGRIAGAGIRGLPGSIGEQTREPLPVRGTSVNVQREYSRDLLRQGIQRLYDRTPRGREARSDTLRGRHYLKEAANRHTSGEEAIRREHARKDLVELKKLLPKKGPLRRLDRKSAEVVNLAVERLIQRPGTFHKDLNDYKTLLEKAQEERTKDGKPALNKREIKANKDLIKQIDAGIKRASPEHVVDAANHFIALQKPILDELVDLKLLTADQAAKASATSFARVHLGAEHDEEHGLVDKEGNPLSLEHIHQEMKRRGVDLPGFLSHRAPANADFYQPSFGGATLEKGGRTGKAVVSGSQLGGVESLVRQLRRSRGLADRAKAWNKAVTRFGIEVKGVDTMADAKRVAEDPERYGLDPSIDPTPVPRHPFAAKKGEMEGALEHQDPALAEESAGAALSRGMDDAQSGSLPDDAKVIFMPGKVAKELRADAEPSGEALKLGQAVTTGFKRTVLPFSPSFFIGNGLDNLIRTTLAGINPAHFFIGVKAHHALNEEQRAQLLAGAHYSSVDAIAPHRSVDAVITGYDPLSKAARGFADWTHKRGAAQAAVKFGPKMISGLSHLLLTTNAKVTEVLPQYGALGKIALKDMRKTQGSWARAITHMDEAVQSFAKGVDDPDKMIRAQRDLEATYGDYTRMSPGARKVLSTVTPFWTWMRAAYTYVYITMPAHHSVQTGLLAATANATRSEREQYGLEKGGQEPVPSYYRGIPLPNGQILPLSNYNSFDFASDPLEAVSSLTVPQVKSVAEALAGRNWKGEEIAGEGNRIKAALSAAAGSFIPLINDLTAEDDNGGRHLDPHLSLPHVISKEKVDKARQPWETISVPVSGGGTSGTAPWEESASSSEGVAPWESGSSSSSEGKAPWE